MLYTVLIETARVLSDLTYVGPTFARSNLHVEPSITSPNSTPNGVPWTTE